MSLIDESKVPLVDKKLIASFFCICFAGVAHVDIEKPIAVDVYHGCATFPSHPASYSRSLSNVFEFEVALIEVQLIELHVRNKVNVFEAIVVDVPNGNPPAIKQVFVRQCVLSRVFNNGVFE